jgi:hypothetical protein
LEASKDNIAYVTAELLRAMVALEHVEDYAHEMKRKDQPVIKTGASVIRCEIADMAQRFLAQKDANQRKMAKLSKMMNGGALGAAIGDAQAVRLRRAH